MRSLRRLSSYLVVAILVSTFSTGAAWAQGLTSAALTGVITREGGQPVEAANVALTNTSTGARLSTTTGANGRYNFENVPPGGPYTIDVRGIGFQPVTKTGIRLSLGQRQVENFELQQQVIMLEELAVTAATNPLINAGRTGAAQTVSGETIRRMPSLGRNFTDLIRTSPQVLLGSSVGGQNGRFNAIQIDGGVNNDIFGLSSGGTPGGSAGAKPISLEAIQEYQVLVAPFDVRQGSFSGGLVNGITRSGTNQFHGSLFGYLQRPDLVGKDTAGVEISQFDIKQYGGTLGGPIIRDRLHFFMSADLQGSTTPFVGAAADDPTTGITSGAVNQVRQILRDRYGFDPGGVEAPQNLNQPDKNFFGKINAQLGGSSQLEVSYNYIRASRDAFSRGTRNLADRDGWQLSNSGYKIGNTTNSIRSKFTTVLGRASLEVLAGYQTVRDAREIANQTPLIMVQDVLGNYMAAGGERFSHGNELDQNILELTANLTFDVGGNHQITIGTHNEIFSFRNVFANNRFGTWTFGSADSLDMGLARRYEIALETRPGGFTADFGVRQLGGYIQDTWRPTRDLTVTGGVRFDVPFSDKPFQNDNPNLLALGVNTGRFPTGNVLFSPRLGFNWDIGGEANTVLRGGVGLFSGRPPYVWMSNAFTNTGLEQATLRCDLTPTTGNGLTPPAFTVDINNMPTSCATGGSAAASTPSVNYFEESFKFQQALKLAVGLDKQLGSGFVATLDFIHTRARNQMYQTDDNVTAGEINGEGRQLYAAPNPAGTALVRLRPTALLGQVIRHANRNADRSTMATVQLQKSFAGGYGFSAAYTHARTEDLMSLGSSTAGSNLRNTALDGTLADRNLRRASYDVPHKVTLSGTATLPLNIELSAIYTARAGTPYAYVYSNDANGDGNAANDLFYVPRDANDISLTNPTAWSRLDEFISSEKCLDEQRGQIMERNSCRNPWIKFLDVRVAKPIRTLSGQSLLLGVDFFNFLNLVNKNWGINRETAPFEQVSNFLTMAGYDTRGTATQSDDRGVYTIPNTMPSRNRALVNSSRWRIQVGAKYLF
ncbi:MAG: TonB-dependent receptor [Gemmatimonadales bacterium]|nr:TonB-dependent receptor [Gemmatimonadales bacterium]